MAERQMTMTIAKTLAFVLTLALLGAACGSDSGSASGGTSDPLVGTVWQLTAGTVDGAPLALLDSHPVTLTSDGAQLSGTSACNGYGGTYTLDGTSFSAGDMQSTMMACFPDEVNALEAAYLGALGRVDTIVAQPDSLVATGDGVTLSFRAQVPTPDAPLVGTTWLLESIITGEAVSSTVAGSAATLTVTAAGAISGSTGCNQFNGSVELGDSTWSATSLATTRMACEEALMVQEQQVVAVLSGGPSSVISGPVLTLTLADGTGLAYRAS